jgi:quinol monooxygenase YgiN
MFVLVVTVEVRPELLEELRPVLLENARRSVERDPGCRRFDVHKVEGSDTHLVFYEVYESERDWLAHRQSPHFLAYQAVAERALVSRTLTRLQPLRLTDAS